MPWKMKWLMAPEGDQPAGGAPAPQNDAPPAAQTNDAPPAITTKGGKVLPMAATTIEKLKREHQDKGRKAYQAELEQKAKELGYQSVDEMFKAAERRGNGRSQQNGGEQRRSGGEQRQSNGEQRRGGQQQQQPQRAKREERQGREYRERLDKERRERIRAQRKAEEHQREAWAAEAHGELKVMALQVGIKDPDYAVTLWTRECNNKRGSMDETAYNKWLDAANEQEFFEGLKKSRPHLFEETVVPANTGTVASGNAPPPPGAGQVTSAQASAAQTSAKKMSKEEYHAELRRRGLQPPTF